MSTSYWQYRNRPTPIEGDVVVVGGGIVGCSTAFWLKSLRPALDVVLVEKDFVAAGASGRNAGFLLQGSSTAYAGDVERLGRDNARRLWKATLDNRNLVEEMFGGADVGFATPGSCTAAGSQEEAERLSRSADLLVSDGFEAEFVDSVSVNRLLESNGFVGGLVVPSGAVVDPVRLSRSLIERSGARVMEKLAVNSVSEDVGGSVRLECGQVVVHAEAAILAVNAYLPILEPDLAQFVRPVRAQMLATAAAGGTPLPMPVYSHDGYYYIRQLDDGRLLLGGARHLHRSEEVGYSLETTSALQGDLASYLSFHFPGRAGAAVERRWAGTMGFSPDGLPVWGRLPGVPRTLWVAGFTGHGMSIALLVGKMMASVVLNEDTSDMSALKVMFGEDRFQADVETSKGQPIVR